MKILHKMKLFSCGKAGLFFASIFRLSVQNSGSNFLLYRTAKQIMSYMFYHMLVQKPNLNLKSYKPKSRYDRSSSTDTYGTIFQSLPQTIYIYYWYVSPSLAEELFKRKTNKCGICQLNRRGVPKGHLKKFRKGGNRHTLYGHHDV